jgi:hypothetical protein
VHSFLNKLWRYREGLVYLAPAHCTIRHRSPPSFTIISERGCAGPVHFVRRPTYLPSTPLSGMPIARTLMRCTKAVGTIRPLRSAAAPQPERDNGSRNAAM